MKLVGPAFPNGHTRTTILAWVQQQSAEKDPEKLVLSELARGNGWQIRTC